MDIDHRECGQPATIIKKEVDWVGATLIVNARGEAYDREGKEHNQLWIWPDPRDEQKGFTKLLENQQFS